MIAGNIPMIGKVAAPAIGAVASVAKATEEQATLKKVAKDFEAVFVRQMLGEMRSSGFGDDMTSSSAVEQFQEMADAKTADTLSERGAFGIAEMLLRQLTPVTRAATAAAAPGKEG